MKTLHHIREMQSEAEALRHQGRTIGVVPTMGYLHEGHASLIRRARERADVVVTTIFVNPTQFGPNEDFAKYPRDLERDTALAAGAGTDILFVPEMAEMYPSPYFTFVTVEEITSVLEGKSRPTHFRGVTTVVAKLFNITKPHLAVFGQKDAQQAVVIERMARDLNFDVEIVIAPIVREEDGLALSSRNVYLSPEERRQSTALFRSLCRARELIARGERRSDVLIGEMSTVIAAEPLAAIDYIGVSDPVTLEECSTLTAGGRALLSLAVRFGKTRLIDNMVVEV